MIVKNGTRGLKLCHLLYYTGAMSVSKEFLHNTKEDYTPPVWAQTLETIPQSRLKLAQLPTPINEWTLPGHKSKHHIYIKRDDLTGSLLSGNKVRKLEFVLAAALDRECRHVITAGGLQSNHCRATAVAAAQLGLKCHLLLRSKQQKDEVISEGNLFLNHICGADVYLIPPKARYLTDIKPRMQLLAEKILKDTGEKSHIIPVGASDEIGFYGYIEGFRELLQQGVLDHVTDIVVTCGSAGTLEALAAANFLSDSNLRIHGFAICDNADYFYDHADEIYRKCGGRLRDVKARNIMCITDNYKGQGYGYADDSVLEFIAQTARETGIVLDPVYTGKAVQGLVHELNSNPNRFKGDKVLFIHTGGFYGAMTQDFSSAFSRYRTSVCRVWPDPSSLP